MPATNATAHPQGAASVPESAFRELIRSFGLVERVMQPHFARFGISASQWGVLRSLHRAEQDGHPRLRLSELSDRLLIRPPSVTGLVDRLERARLVARDDSPTDLRARPVGLTRAGRRLVQRVLAVHGEQVQTVMAGLTAEQQGHLQDLLVQWRKHLEALLDPGHTNLS
ncbi:MAG: MarR family transcriptional regulator [Gemmataceae bacterium]|nr:MarR family transcriptional regulator [Gemmataceae bacterium]